MKNLILNTENSSEKFGWNTKSLPVISFTTSLAAMILIGFISQWTYDHSLIGWICAIVNILGVFTSLMLIIRVTNAVTIHQNNDYLSCAHAMRNKDMIMFLSGMIVFLNIASLLTFSIYLFFGI